MVVYAVAVAAYRIGRPELRQSILRLRGGLGMDGWARGCHVSVSVGEALCGIGSPLLTVFR